MKVNVTPLEKNLINISKTTITNCFKSDLSMLYKLLADHCVLISTETDLLIGKSDIMSHFNAKVAENELIRIVRDRYYSMQLQSNTYNIYATLEVIFLTKNMHRVYELSATYTVDHNNVEIVSIHYSLKDAHSNMYLKTPEARDETMLHLYRSILQDHNSVTRLAIPTLSNTSYIDPYSIIYIQSFERNCELILFDRVICCTLTLSQIKEILPDYFYSIHRSYIINTHYVLSVQRYAATMIFGKEIPIPQKTYNQAVKDLEKIMHVN